MKFSDSTVKKISRPGKVTRYGASRRYWRPVLNMAPHSKLQREAFGGQPSEQIDDYRGLDEFIATPRGADLRKIVDPWEYRQRLTQPKLLIFGTNDRYWPLDACGPTASRDKTRERATVR